MADYTSVVACPPPIRKFTLGLACGFYIDYEGNVFSFGDTFEGKIGITKFAFCPYIFPPQKIEGLKNIKMVACSIEHTSCIDFDGGLFTFGSNEYGQLGIGKNRKSLLSTHCIQTINIPPIDYISCGSRYTLCITKIEGELYSFGSNSQGELGIGNNNNSNLPVKVKELSKVEMVECGANHSICKTESGEIYSWGRNDCGQLGHGSYNTCNKPTLCNEFPNDIVSIKCGVYHSLVLTCYGFVYGFGKNKLYSIGGQIGMGEEVNHILVPTLIKDLPLIQKIECGDNCSWCLDIENNSWVFGENFGNLGLNDRKCRFKPSLSNRIEQVIDVTCFYKTTFVKTADNKIYILGSRGFMEPENYSINSRNRVRPIEDQVKRVFENEEHIWRFNNSKQKSARK